MSRHDYCYSLTWAAVELGLIIPAWFCENKECGKIGGFLHRHHEDYNKPLEVVQLCPQCHAKRHAEIRKEKNQAFFKWCHELGEAKKAQEETDKIKNEIND